MASWRPLLFGLVVLAVAAAGAASVTTPLLVVPPLLAAALVLAGAAVAVDYFGLARRREGWGGFAADERRAWARARALELRFARERGNGSPRCSWTARSLLLALAAVDRLDEAGEVVDFLGADSLCGRVGADPVADALRAVALAELGRGAEAETLCRALIANRRARRHPVVGYAAARVAELQGRSSEALSHVEATLRRPMPGAARRDLRILAARVHARSARIEEAAETLAELAGGGHRRQVEQVAERAHARGQAAVALAARRALSRAAPFR